VPFETLIPLPSFSPIRSEGWVGLELRLWPAALLSEGNEMGEAGEGTSNR
jgi:hypothetical protein